MKFFIHLVLSITTAWLAWTPGYAACGLAKPEVPVAQGLMPCHSGAMAVDVAAPSPQQQAANTQSAACPDDCASVCHFAGLLLPVLEAAGSDPVAPDHDEAVRTALPSHNQRLLRPPSALQS